MYRTPSSLPEGAVRYGPFPLAWWKLALAPVLWFVAFCLDGIADVREQIDCGAQRCEIRTRGWRRPPWALSGDRGLLQGAEVGSRMKQKNGSWRGTVGVRLSNGGRLPLESEPLDVAERQAQQVNEYAAGKTQSFRYDSGDKRWLRPVSWAVYAAGGLLVASALRRRRALVLRVSGGSVQVEELGPWRMQPARSVPHGEARDVVVSWHQTRAPGPKTTAQWGATLELKLQNGRTVELTTVPREGLAAHYDAAVALRELLDLPERGPVRGVCPDDQAAGLLSGMLPAVWLGLCCGSLSGMALYAVAKVVLDPPSIDRNVDEAAMVAAAAGALGLAGLLVSLVLARDRERLRYQELAGLLGPGPKG